MKDKKALTPKRWFGIAVLTLFLFFLLGIIVFPRGERGATDSTASTPGASQAALADGCAGAGSSDDESVRDRKPKDTQWVTTDSGWTAPKAEVVGPLVDSPLRACFEHSAEGALYSSAWTLVQINDPQVRDSALEQLLTGPGQEAAKKSLRDSKTRHGESSFHIAGYRYLSYSPDRATIRLMIQTSGGDYRSMDMIMVWENSDWRLYVPQNVENSISRVTDTSRFIIWGA